MKNLVKIFSESDVLSLDFASLLSSFLDFGSEIAFGILAFGIPTILEAAKSCFGRDVAEAWSESENQDKQEIKDPTRQSTMV